MPTAPRRSRCGRDKSPCPKEFVHGCFNKPYSDRYSWYHGCRQTRLRNENRQLTNPYDLKRCRVVLVRPHFDGNVGSVARLMLNFGLDDLVCVAPIADLFSLEARRMATHGWPILESARIVETLDEALEGTAFVLCASGKVAGQYRESHYGRPDELLPRLVDVLPQAPTALVFGPEPHGLSNEDVIRCHGVMRILTAPTETALNLSQAVGICLYELHMTQLRKQGTALSETREIASFEVQERMFGHLREALESLHFIFGQRADSLMHAFRQLIVRAHPSPGEVKILHGLARQILWQVRHGTPLEQPIEVEDNHPAD